MDEVRCPMCSKPNPADAEECEFCGARIKPLIIRQEPEELPPRKEPSPITPKEPSQEKAPAETDWISRMRFGVETDQEAEEEEGEEEAGPRRGETDLLGRFRDLGISDEGEEPARDEILAEDQEPSFEDLRPREDVFEIETPLPEDTLPDLPKMEIKGEPGEEEPPIPDWLARIRAKKETEEVEPSPKMGDTDWLTELRGVAFTEDQSDEREPALEEEFPVPEEQEEEGDADGLGFLDDLIKEEDRIAEVDDIEASVATSVDELFSDLDLIAPAEREREPGEGPEVGFGAPSFGEAEELLPEDFLAELESTSEEEEDLLAGDEFLTGFEVLEEDKGGLVISEDLFADEKDLPQGEDRGSFLETLHPETGGGELEESDQFLDANFFADLGLEVADEDEVRARVRTEPSSTEVTRELTSPEDEFAEEEDLERMLQDLAPGSDQLARGPVREAFDEDEFESIGTSPFTDIPDQKESLEDILGEFSPSWLDDTISEEGEELPHVPALILDEEMPPIDLGAGETEVASIEIPDWLHNLGKDIEEEELIAEDEDIPVLAKATLPPWLEAMRPIGTFRAPPEIDLEEEEEIVESAGPLAGLKGVLLAEPVVAMPHAPAIVVGALDITERDYSQADILREMVEEEEREEGRAEVKQLKVPVLRWICAGLLVLAVSLPSALDIPTFQSPYLGPRDFSPFIDLIHNLPVDQPALLVFDYEPSYSAEMDAVAGAFVEDLVSRGQPVITLSTHPSGSLLADRMLRRVSLLHDVQNGEGYLHLGYLSGGSTALQLFTASPTEALTKGFNLPEGWEDESVWDSPILAGVHQLSDFAIVAVITSGTESARNWTEQAHPYMGGKPLVMVLSAGTEPLIRPYYEGDNPQIAGILTGLPSAMFYERENGLQADASQRWNAYGAGVLISALILLAGGGYGIVSWLMRRLSLERD
jgi:hypothetical protein